MKNWVKKLGILVCICVPLFGWAQEEEENDKPEVQTLIKGDAHHGGFLALAFKGTRIDEQTAVLVGMRGGWNINRILALGFEGYGLVPTVRQSDIVSTHRVRPLLGYGGFFIEPIVGSNKAIHATFPLLLGAGWAGYIDDWDDLPNNVESDLVDEQVFWLIEPGANLEVNLTHRMRMTAGVSYRFTDEIVLLNTAKDAFNGMNFNLGLKFGRF